MLLSNHIFEWKQRRVWVEQIIVWWEKDLKWITSWANTANHVWGSKEHQQRTKCTKCTSNAYKMHINDTPRPPQLTWCTNTTGSLCREHTKSRSHEIHKKIHPWSANHQLTICRDKKRPRCVNLSFLPSLKRRKNDDGSARWLRTTTPLCND